MKDFLAHLAIGRNVSASTQNLAFNSLLMFFRMVFNQELGDMKSAVRAKQSQRLPVVFSKYLGHAKVETTMIYTHVIKDLRNPTTSPLDLLQQ